MKFRTILIASACMIASAAFAADTKPDAPAAAPSVRVAIANAGRVLVEMQETKDLDVKIKGELKNLEGINNEKQTQLKDLQTSRNNLRPESPQWQERNKELIQKAIEFEVWQKMTQADVQRHQKEQMRILFNKIQLAISEVAAEKGFDLVISDQRVDLPENLDQVNMDQLRGMINQRIVLFANPKVDITPDVIARLDLKYSKGGK